jgi:succinate dehydrogenase (ubiquinone) cytochrome b560 subunit
MTKNISPHVSIYKFPITALSSISTRLTGIYLSGLFIAGGIASMVNKEDYLYQKYKNLNNPYKNLFHYSVIFPTTYHTFGGIRHFMWDKFPQLLTNNKVAKSSYLLFGVSSALSLAVERSFND